MEHFREIISRDSNIISINLKNIPYSGLDTFAYILILDRLIQLRDIQSENYKVSFEIVKSD